MTTPTPAPTPSPTTTPTPTPTAMPTAAPGAPVPVRTKLPNGELRRMVAQFLLDYGHTGWSAGSIARHLGRSSGAVGNALELLASRGQAEQVNDRPRRYIPTATTSAAATAPAAGPAPPTPTSGSPAPARRPRASRRRTPAAAPGTPAATTGAVIRPNGQLYRPRKLADLADVDALRRLREAGVPALLYGPPGTGKTSLIEAAYPDLLTVAGDGDTTVGDLVGEYTQAPDGGYTFVYGPLVRAMLEGRALLLDDATLISPKVLAVVYPAMDGRKEIIVKAHTGEAIAAAPGFFVVAGHNPGVHGAVLTEALASRFSAHIHVSTDFDLAATLGVDARAVKVARNLSARVGRGDIGWAPQLRELLAYQKLAGVLGEQPAIANLVGIAPEEDRDVVADVVATVYGARVTPLAVGRQV